MPKTIKFLIATHMKPTSTIKKKQERKKKKHIFDYVISVNKLNGNILKMLQVHIFQHQLTIISQLGRHISNNKLLPSSTSMVICVTETKQKFFYFSKFSASYFGNSVSCVLTTKHFILISYITTTHK